MNIRSIQSGHWTDDELLAQLYGVGPSGDHLEKCEECQLRLKSMQLSRERLETAAPLAEQVSSDFLATQRRAIYQRMERPVRWWSSAAMRRWAAGTAAAGVLCGSLVIYDQNRRRESALERANDAKLVQEVAAMAKDTSTTSMAPLEGLFE